jgi:hypothetical protein
MKKDKYTVLAAALRNELPEGVNRVFATSPVPEWNRIIVHHLVGDNFSTMDDLRNELIRLLDAHGFNLRRLHQTPTGFIVELF